MLTFVMVFSWIGDLTQRQEGHRFVSDLERSLLGHAYVCGPSAAVFEWTFKSDRKNIIYDHQRIREEFIPYLSIPRRILLPRTRRRGQGGIISDWGNLKTSNTPSRRLTPVDTKPGSFSCFRKTNCVKNAGMSHRGRGGFCLEELGVLRKVRSRPGMSEKIVSESLDIVHFLCELSGQKTRIERN
jgi:hypothetical protein